MGTETGKEDIKVKIQKAAILVIGLTLALFHIYTSFFGALPSYQHRIIHLVMSMMLVPLCYDLFKFKNNTGKLIYQVIFIGILAVIGIYSYSIANDMWKQSGTMSIFDMVPLCFHISLAMVSSERPLEFRPSTYPYS